MPRLTKARGVHWTPPGGLVFVPFSFGGGQHCFVYCVGCGRVGREGWAHIHGDGNNWFRTVAELVAAGR